MEVTKLDRRYDGYGRFSHRVEFSRGRPLIIQKQWVRARNWLWASFGPSAELNIARPEMFDGVQPKWAWDSEKSAIYLVDDAYTMFMLRKEYWENVENL